MTDRQSVLNVEYQTALTNNEAAERRWRWASVLNLTPFPDGNQWCVLWGQDLQVGIAGFGPSPEAAINDFDNAMRTAKPPTGDSSDEY